jgi:hypothetical protein
MSNGEVCCILGVCCPPGGEAQFDHTVEMVQKQRPHFSQADAENAAHRLLKAHDFFRGVQEAIDTSDEQAV